MTHQSSKLSINSKSHSVCPSRFLVRVSLNFLEAARRPTFLLVSFDAYDVPCSFYYLFIFLTDLVTHKSRVACPKIRETPLCFRRRSPQDFELRREGRDVTTRKGMLLLRFIVERKIRYLKLCLCVCAHFPSTFFPLSRLFHVSLLGPTIVTICVLTDYC